MPEAPVREKAPPERFDLKMSRDLIFLSLTQTMSEKCIIHFYIDPTNCWGCNSVHLHKNIHWLVPQCSYLSPYCGETFAQFFLKWRVEILVLLGMALVVILRVPGWGHPVHQWVTHVTLQTSWSLIKSKKPASGAHRRSVTKKVSLPPPDKTNNQIGDHGDNASLTLWYLSIATFMWLLLL